MQLQTTSFWVTSYPYLAALVRKIYSRPKRSFSELECMEFGRNLENSSLIRDLLLLRKPENKPGVVCNCNRWIQLPILSNQLANSAKTEMAPTSLIWPPWPHAGAWSSVPLLWSYSFVLFRPIEQAASSFGGLRPCSSRIGNKKKCRNSFLYCARQIKRDHSNRQSKKSLFLSTLSLQQTCTLSRQSGRFLLQVVGDDCIIPLHGAQQPQMIIDFD